MGSTKLAATVALGAPVAAGVIVGGAAAGVYGVANTIKYAKSEKSGGQALKDTVKGSAGVGVSAALGVAAAHAVAGTALALGTTAVVQVAAGVAAAYAGLRIWHRVFFNQQESSEADD